MAKSLDFNLLKKRYLTVKLADEEQTVLMISTPTKSVLDSFIALRDTISDETVGDEAIEELYDICAKIMSRNKTGKVITREKLEDVFDFEDVIIFIRAYTDFINEVSNSKN